MKLSWRALWSAAVGAALGLGAFAAHAQVIHESPGPLPSTGAFAMVVTTCGTDTMSNSQYGILQVDPTGRLCINSTATGVTFTNATVGTSHGQVLASSLVTRYLLLVNPSALGGNTIYCSPGGTAVVNAAGTLPIAPGQYVTFENNAAPSAAIDCIATGSSTPLTIGYQ